MYVQGEGKLEEDQVQGGVRATLKALKGKSSQWTIIVLFYEWVWRVPFQDIQGGVFDKRRE